MTVDIEKLHDTMCLFRVGDRAESLLRPGKIGVIKERHFVTHDPRDGVGVAVMYMVYFQDAEPIVEREFVPHGEHHLRPLPPSASSAPPR